MASSRFGAHYYTPKIILVIIYAPIQYHKPSTAEPPEVRTLPDHGPTTSTPDAESFNPKPLRQLGTVAVAYFLRLMI